MRYINLNLTLSIFVSVILFSCNSLLDQEPKDFLTPEASYNTESGAQEGVNALYATLRDAYFSFTDFNNGRWSTRISDLGYNGEEPGGDNGPNTYSYITPTSPYIVAMWDKGFEIIKMTNALIDGVENADPENFTNGEEDKNRYIAEGRFIRAWEYRYMVSSFGDVPLLTEPVVTAKTDFERTPVKEVYQQMVEDFKFAAEHLPPPGDEGQPGRLTQGPAWHFLGETYLELGQPQDAITALSHVIDDYNYGLMTERFGGHLDHDVFGAGDPFYDLFRNGNQNLKENKEAMWVAQIELDVPGGSQNQWAYAFGPRYFDIGPGPDGVNPFLGVLFNGSPTSYVDTFSRPTADQRPTSFVIYEMWKDDEGDRRNERQNFIRHLYSNNPESMFYGRALDDFVKDYGNNRPNMSDTTKVFYPFFTKGLDPMNYPKSPSLGGGGITGTDWYILRFAETLLLRAEAYLDNNQKDLAAQDINKVRNRSNAKSVAPEEVTIDYILDERARELWGEEFRLISLRRTNKLIERVKKYNDNPAHPGAGIKDYNFRLPIPLEAIDLNTTEFPQNPGY